MLILPLKLHVKFTELLVEYYCPSIDDYDFKLFQADFNAQTFKVLKPPNPLLIKAFKRFALT